MESIRRVGSGMFVVVAWCMLSGCSEGGGGSSASSASIQAAGQTVPTANLLFKSNFGPGVTLGPPDLLYPTGGFQALTGMDGETGYSWPVAAVGSNLSAVQLIAPVPVTSSTVSNYVRSEIRSVVGPKGDPVSELFMETVDNGGVGNTTSAQVDLLINRPWTIGDIPHLYISFWFKLQPNLVASLNPNVSSGNWLSMTEFKTGGHNNTWRGDYRSLVVIVKGTDGALYWVTRGDNNANRLATDSSGSPVSCPHTVYCPLVTYWREENRTVPVPIDTWAKMEVYWHRSSGDEGRYWAAVNGQVIADHHGPTMGEFGLPINRIFVALAYGGGHPPIESHATGIEIWDGFPCGDGVPCQQ